LTYALLHVIIYITQGVTMTIYIVDIEAVDTRYTKQWKEHLPAQLKRCTNKEVEVISGGDTPQATTPGAFLNFGGTNVYKSKQLEIIGEKFCNGEIKDNDYFLYTDAWNPTVIQLKYMSELLGVKIRIGGMWHAGSYDPQDFLGRLIGDEPWVRSAEHSMFSCYDDNFFATQFHINMFANETFNWNNGKGWDCSLPQQANKSIKLAGWPMEYLENSLNEYKGMPKEDIILFPHRIAPEKQLDIFKDLAKQLPEYQFIVCQEQELTKDEYHKLLGRAKIVFSANLQETLGISWYEGLMLNCIPMVPNRLSYREMASNQFKYPSYLTKDFKTYEANRARMADYVKYYMNNYDKFVPTFAAESSKLSRNYFSGNKLYEVINGEY